LRCIIGSMVRADNFTIEGTLQLASGAKPALQFTTPSFAVNQTNLLFEHKQNLIINQVD